MELNIRAGSAGSKAGGTGSKGGGDTGCLAVAELAVFNRRKLCLASIMSRSFSAACDVVPA